MNLHKFQLQYLRQKNQQALLESLVVMVGALFVVVLLPQVLIRFVYADQQLFAEPMVLQVIPAVGLGIGVLHLLVTLVSNFMRNRQLAKLEKSFISELSQPATIDEAELKELEQLVDTALTKHSTKPAARRAATKKRTVKKTTTRTRTTKK